MYRRMASRKNSLTVRPSSFTTCWTCSAISGGIEKAMTLDFLGVDTLSFCLSLYNPVILYTTGHPAFNYQGGAAAAVTVPIRAGMSEATTWGSRTARSRSSTATTTTFASFPFQMTGRAMAA